MGKLTQDKLSAFITVLANTGRVDKACEAIDISRYTAYQWRDTNSDFAAAWEKAKRISASHLEDEAHRRAVDGVTQEIYDKDGNVVSTRTTYSDTLLTFLLKANDPEKFSDKTEVRHSGGIQLLVNTGVPDRIEDASYDVIEQQPLQIEDVSDLA